MCDGTTLRRPHRCWLVRTHFQIVGTLETAGTSCGRQAAGFSDVRRSSAGWITAMLRWLVSQPTLSVDSGRFRTQRPSSSSGFIASTVSLTLSSASIVYECRKGSFSMSPCRLTGRCMVMLQLRSIFGSSRTSPIDTPFQRRLWSSTFDHLLVHAVKLSNFLMDVALFSVAGARTWNDLPSDVTSSPSLLTFKHRLKCTYFTLPTQSNHLNRQSPSPHGHCSSCLLLKPR